MAGDFNPGRTSAHGGIFILNELSAFSPFGGNPGAAFRQGEGTGRTPA
jgi:hypothetical protein